MSQQKQRENIYYSNQLNKNGFLINYWCSIFSLVRQNATVDLLFKCQAIPVFWLLLRKKSPS